MAVTSSRQLQQLTPPSSSHGGRGSWDFAVPLDSAKSSQLDYAPFMNDNTAAAQSYSPRQPPQQNGLSQAPRSNTLDSQTQYYEDEPSYAMSNRVGDLTATNDPEGPVEHYSRSESRTRSESRARSESRNGASTKGKGKKKSSKNQPPPGWVEAESNENNWIHRDKLKEIEIREMEAAGFRVGRFSRSNSRSQSTGRHMSRDRASSEATDASNLEYQFDYRRNISPIPAEGEEDVAEQQTWDVRTAEEIATDREQYAARDNHVVRPSTSRIPVAKASSIPVPNQFVERDQPLPRSRSNSENWDPDALATNGARVRSGSMSSQILLNEPQTVDAPAKSPVKKSPATTTAKAKTAAKSTPGTRKVTPKLQSKPRNASAGSPTKRPGTSGGSVSRPGTSHRPEGEAPWVATMYKPDPMLPPDQQIIPTHAKRMQQEKWQNEGQVASIYDKEFNVLKAGEFPEKRASQLSPIDIEKAQAEGAWPLPSPDKLAPSNVEPGPKSPVSEAGSYKLTPNITHSPRTPSTPSHKVERRVAPVIDPLPTNTTRLPEPPAETEKDQAKEKKACCCIVM